MRGCGRLAHYDPAGAGSLHEYARTRAHPDVNAHGENFQAVRLPAKQRDMVVAMSQTSPVVRSGFREMRHHDIPAVRLVLPTEISNKP